MARLKKRQESACCGGCANGGPCENDSLDKVDRLLNKLVSALNIEGADENPQAFNCPQGQMWDREQELCVPVRKEAVHPVGGGGGSSDGKDKPCPEGMKRNPITGKCEPKKK